MIFKRIAAWSATISKAGPAEAIERYLRLTTRDRYWFGDKNPELVRFYCRRWNRLDQRTRARLEAVILAGMKAETGRRFPDAGPRKRARAYSTENGRESGRESGCQEWWITGGEGTLK